jgi:hypothetical protein
MNVNGTCFHVPPNCRTIVIGLKTTNKTVETEDVQILGNGSNKVCFDGDIMSGLNSEECMLLCSSGCFISISCLKLKKR